MRFFRLAIAVMLTTTSMASAQVSCQSYGNQQHLAVTVKVSSTMETRPTTTKATPGKHTAIRHSVLMDRSIERYGIKYLRQPGNVWQHYGNQTSEV